MWSAWIIVSFKLLSGFKFCNDNYYYLEKLEDLSHDWHHDYLLFGIHTYNIVGNNTCTCTCIIMCMVYYYILLHNNYQWCSACMWLSYWCEWGGEVGGRLCHESPYFVAARTHHYDTERKQSSWNYFVNNAMLTIG